MVLQRLHGVVQIIWRAGELPRSASSHFHYQGRIDFNTVNIHCNVGMYSLAIGMILNDVIFRDDIIQYTPCSLGSLLGITAQGTAFLDTLLGQISVTHPGTESIDNAPAMMQIGTM